MKFSNSCSRNYISILLLLFHILVQVATQETLSNNGSELTKNKTGNGTENWTKDLIERASKTESNGFPEIAQGGQTLPAHHRNVTRTTYRGFPRMRPMHRPIPRPRTGQRRIPSPIPKPGTNHRGTSVSKGMSSSEIDAIENKLGVLRDALDELQRYKEGQDYESTATDSTNLSDENTSEETGSDETLEEGQQLEDQEQIEHMIEDLVLQKLLVKWVRSVMNAWLDEVSDYVSESYSKALLELRLNALTYSGGSEGNLLDFGKSPKKDSPEESLLNGHLSLNGVQSEESSTNLAEYSLVNTSEEVVFNNSSNDWKKQNKLQE